MCSGRKSAATSEPMSVCRVLCFFFQAEDGIRDWSVTGVQTCALPICGHTHFLPALPETVFEADDALFVLVGKDQGQPLIDTQHLRELPRLEERQHYDALDRKSVV